ncbi:MOSC domain-containing protein [Solicola gregarius]|uniref:MOSC domain-containing protein n=1 Tax=Solicola gregarius TaxID=2908642 RepID=A0AA46TJU5_9ACTN|nr:MOSC domain-containing protein [Solicola gregarius]UYM06595.1 MOSC domain-containing protein [Solicola gregarius]
MSRLERIVRYPVKGLRGQPLDGARLEDARGLAYDRALAIETGSAPEADGWAARETFYHLARDTQLIRYAARVDETADGPTAVLEPPDAEPISVRLAESYREGDLAAASARVAEMLPGGRLRPPRLTMPGVALWDWPHATLSLINLDTIDELSERAGRDLDPRRFRANLYVSGLGAWAELGLVGRRIRIGDVLLEVIQPTDRCRATTVDPRTGDTELNLPALLAGRLGHMFCGVYVRVVGAGRVEVGSPVSVESTTGVRPAAAERRWPRRAYVAATVRESDEVTSFWLRDPLGFAADALPGQHLRIHPEGDPSSPLWRCYTISAVEGDAYRISVKRDGAVSSLLHDGVAEDETLIVSGPFGEVTLDDDSLPVLLVSAGIGLTPTVAMLRSLGASEREVRVVHVDRGEPPAGLWREVESALDRLPRGSAVRYDTTVGRPGPDAIAGVVREFSAEPLAYVCGPAGFYDDVRDALLGAGLDAASIRHEVFFSPSTAERTEPKPPPRPGPFSVRFAASDDADSYGSWDAERGSLLDVGESLGLPMPSGCRAGVCGSCALRVPEGSTAYVTDPSVPAPDGTVLLCSAVPTSDVTIDLAR